MEPKFKVNNIKLVSCWGFNLSSNVDCTICRCSLNSQSIYNQEKGLDSKIIIGLCGHAFHIDCLNPWLVMNNNCPICSVQWKST